MQFGSDVEFDGNQALNMVLHKAATAALGVALVAMGQVGYDTTALRVKVSDGSTVRRLLQDNDISTDQTLGGASASDIITASQKAIKTYVDNLLTQGQSAFVDFDASSATQLPTGSTLSSRYRVTAAGTVQTVKLQAMDTFYPRVSNASPTVASDWIFVQGNADEATNSVLGMVLLATLSEINANIAGNANKVITVSQLNAWETALGRVRKFTTVINIAVGANGVNHGLNTPGIQMQAMDANGQIYYKWTRTNDNTLSITANKAKSNVTIVVEG